MHELEVNDFLLRAYNDIHPNHPFIDFLEDVLEEFVYNGFHTIFEGKDVTIERSEIGGYNCDGEQIYLVFRIGEEYFKYSGYYSSWDGRKWDLTPEQVFPRVVEVVHWD